MITFKDLDQVLRRSGQQVSVQQLLNNRMYIKNQGWKQIKLTNELREEIALRASEILGGWQATQNKVFNRLNVSNNVPQHWTLDRMYIEKYHKKPARIYYCAGQNMPYEINQGRTYIKTL